MVVGEGEEGVVKLRERRQGLLNKAKLEAAAASEKSAALAVSWNAIVSKLSRLSSGNRSFNCTASTHLPHS